MILQYCLGIIQSFSKHPKTAKAMHYKSKHATEKACSDDFHWTLGLKNHFYKENTN